MRIEGIEPDKLSFPYIDAAWMAECETPAMKVVLVSLADHADSNGHCYPSIPRMAKRCSMSQRSVWDQLQKLRKAKIIRIKSQRPRSNRYDILLPIETCKPCTLNKQTTVNQHATFAREPSVTVTEPKGISPYLLIHLERLEKKEEKLRAELEAIRNNAARDAFGKYFYTPDEIASRVVLKQKLNDLATQRDTFNPQSRSGTL